MGGEELTDAASRVYRAIGTTERTETELADATGLRRSAVRNGVRTLLRENRVYTLFEDGEPRWGRKHG